MALFENDGPLSITNIEDAFGLEAGDLKLLSRPDSLPYVLKNAWTEIEGLPLRVTRLETVIPTQSSNIAKFMIAVGPSVYEMVPGGKAYNEHFVYGVWRFWNTHIHYEVFAYVNENTRLMAPLPHPVTGATKIEKMTDLWLATVDNTKCVEGEAAVCFFEGPKKGKYANGKEEGNIGKFFIGGRIIDMDKEVSCATPKWLIQRKEKKGTDWNGTDMKWNKN